MSERQYACVGRERLAKGLDQLIRIARGGRDLHVLQREPAATGAHRPSDVVGRMVLIPEHDFVASAEVEPVVDDVVRFAGVPNQRDLVGLDTDLIRDGRTGTFQILLESGAILERAIDIDRARQFGHGLRDPHGRRAQIGRIHRHPLFAKREHLPNPLPVPLVGSGGVRRRPGSQRGCGSDTL